MTKSKIKVVVLAPKLPNNGKWLRKLDNIEGIKLVIDKKLFEKVVKDAKKKD